MCVQAQKKNSTQGQSPHWSLVSPVHRKDQGESWSTPGPYAFSPCLPDVFIRCCRRAKLQINKAISTSQPLTLTREDLLVATAARAHRDLIISLWLAGYWEPHPWAWYHHRAEACHLRGAGISRSALILHVRQAWLFSTGLSTNLQDLEAPLWSGSSFLINNDLLILSESSSSLYSFSVFLKSSKTVHYKGK